MNTEKTQSPETLRGTCLCGEVRFAVSPPTLWCGHCHCGMCQRAHGAAFVTWVGCSSERVTIEGEPLSWHGSSVGARRGFCSRCGSSLFFESERWPGETHITLANFADPIDRAPAGDAFFETHVSWFEFPDSGTTD